MHCTLVNEPVQKLLGLGLARVAHGNAILFSALWLPGATALPLAIAWALHVTIERRWSGPPSRRVRLAAK